MAEELKRQIHSARPSDTARKRKKDPSHLPFYAGFIRGMLCSIEGAFLFLSHSELAKVLRNILKPVLTAQLVYFAIGVALWVLFRNSDVGKSNNLPTTLVSSFWQWSRIISTGAGLVLERKVKSHEVMYEASLKAKNTRFANELSRIKPHRVEGEVVLKYVRIAKLTAFRLMGFLIKRFFPKHRNRGMAILKFFSIRSVLGSKLSFALAAVELLPGNILGKTFFDDALVFAGEALLDAFDLGKDSTKFYYKRLPSLETRQYFRARYHGYLTGMGFLYSMCLGVPFLGVLVSIIAECGAACLVVEIVERNLQKETRQSLPGEDSLKPKVS